MINKKKKTLKSLKEETESCFEEANYEKVLYLCEEIKNTYPKNEYGYINYLKSATKNYKSYITNDRLKELKKVYEEAISILKEDKKAKLKQVFDDYVDDCNEVENLKKVKKELISKYLLKNIYNENITYINQNITTIKSYDLKGKKIINFYDFIKGVFFLFCLVFNLIYINNFLFITIPFGIFGIITIYTFINSNFLGGKIPKFEKKYGIKIVEKSKKEIDEIKNEIKKIEENITFYDSLKKETMLKIPETFLTDLENQLDDDEDDIAKKIYEELLNNNISSFTYLLSENTFLKPEDIIEKLRIKNDQKENEISNFINEKNKQKIKNKNNFMLMKPVSMFNYFVICFLLVISLLSIIVIINNFYEINLTAFIVAIIIGIISMLTYNINSSKHTSLKDVFNNNLLSTIFNTSLIYNLVYDSIYEKLTFRYGFVQMPIIFILIFIGFVASISLLKYKNLINKLRG